MAIQEREVAAAKPRNINRRIKNPESKLAKNIRSISDLILTKY